LFSNYLAIFNEETFLKGAFIGDSVAEKNYLYIIKTGLVKVIKRIKIPRQLGLFDTVYITVMDFGSGEIVNEGPLIGMEQSY